VISSRRWKQRLMFSDTERAVASTDAVLSFRCTSRLTLSGINSVGALSQMLAASVKRIAGGKGVRRSALPCYASPGTMHRFCRGIGLDRTQKKWRSSDPISLCAAVLRLGMPRGETKKRIPPPHRSFAVILSCVGSHAENHSSLAGIHIWSDPNSVLAILRVVGQGLDGCRF
jgi:hypothetical protein